MLFYGHKFYNYFEFAKQMEIIDNFHHYFFRNRNEAENFNLKISSKTVK